MAEIKDMKQMDACALAAHRSPRWASRPGASAVRERQRDNFDAAAWMAVIDEQKLLIARASGVDPAKVRIQIGH